MRGVFEKHINICKNGSAEMLLSCTEQESNQRNRLKEALRKGTLLKNPPAATPNGGRKCPDFRLSTLSGFVSFWALAGEVTKILTKCHSEEGRSHGVGISRYHVTKLHNSNIHRTGRLHHRHSLRLLRRPPWALSQWHILIVHCFFKKGYIYNQLSQGLPQRGNS